MAQAAQTLLRLKAWTDAEPILREALAIREAKEPDAWTTFNTKSMLGGALLGQKRYTDAEPLLRAGYEGMKARADKIPPQGKVRLVEALDRLIELAEATNRPDDAKRWKDEKAKLPAPGSPELGSEKR
jgi:eukaryotic-like serine/threonine-protein kinase